MASLKKSLFLVLFLGFVSLSICEEEKRENEGNENEEEDENHEEGSEEKRGLLDLAKHVIGIASKLGKRSEEKRYHPFGKRSEEKRYHPFGKRSEEKRYPPIGK
uniref:Preprofallaxidin-6 n=2 Tax=Litoria fallax TaxID=115422 RepID=FALX6_LITFA|nr:RecName: Full=Preprofallaxidin-6; Contains: RecName: Full=Fallaxidin-1.3; Contains: RecName: Full=Fallaxidin-1.4; Contains: RecName: Full=Fallaxidin-3.1; Flags: Precursor [Litoria fallax]ACH53451.1 preprofallaxidin [Litoria fallax]